MLRTFKNAIRHIIKPLHTGHRLEKIPAAKLVHLAASPAWPDRLRLAAVDEVTRRCHDDPYDQTLYALVRDKWSGKPGSGSAVLDRIGEAVPVLMNIGRRVYQRDHGPTLRFH